MRADNEVRAAFRACRKALIAVGLFSLALNLLMLTQPLYMTSVYDRVLSSRSQETLMVLTIAAVGALAVIGVLEMVRQIVLMRAGARLETALGGRVLDASLQMSHRSGSDVQGLRDLAQLRQFISSPLVSALFDAPVAPFYLALVYIIHPHLGWLSLGAAVLLLIVSIANQQMTKAALTESSQHGLSALQKAQVQARNSEVIRAMGMFSNSVASWGADNCKAMMAADIAGRRNAVFTGLTRVLRLFLQLAVLGYGAYLVLVDNSLSAGIIFAASIVSARALAPIDQVVGGWKSFASAIQSHRRLKELLAATRLDTGRMPLPAPRPSLAVEKLAFVGAPGTEPILKGLTFTIEPGDAVGVIGPSGAGKSTLARLLVGALKPTAGVVRIGGDDLQHWPSEALGPFIGYVPQDVELFPATVAQNIARMHNSPDPAAVVAAAQLANCHDLIQRLPKGYDTLLGPMGHALSGGQRQRIALARAFYGRPRLVVLDEPNASLDAEGEQALTSALIAAQQNGITCVVITQRTAVVRALTKIMVMKDGRIESFGPREEVLQQQIRPAPKPVPEPHQAPANAAAAAPVGRVAARLG